MFKSLNHKIHQYMRVIVLNSKICNGFHSSNSLTQSYTHHFPYLYKHLCSSFSLLINISLILYTPHSLSGQTSLFIIDSPDTLLLTHYICYPHTPLYSLLSLLTQYTHLLVHYFRSEVPEFYPKPAPGWRRSLTFDLCPGTGSSGYCYVCLMAL